MFENVDILSKFLFNMILKYSPMYHIREHMI